MLERGLPTAKKGREVRIPWPAALHWYVRQAVERARTESTGAVPGRVNQHQFAELVGLTPRQVHNLVKEKVIPTAKDGGKVWYPIPEALHAYQEHKVRTAAGAPDDA